MWTVIAVICAVLAPVIAIFLWIYLLNGDRGERYMKQATQGPFVPVHPDHDKSQKIDV